MSDVFFIEKNKARLIAVLKFLLTFLPVFFLIVFNFLLFPYVTSKVFSFRIIVEIAFLLYFCLVLIDKNYYPKKSILLFLILGYFGVQVVSSLFGGNFYHSFWGNYERMDGIVTHMHYFLYFVMLVSVFKDKKDWGKLLAVSFWVGLILFLIGLLQRMGLQIFTQVFDVRIRGTFGNAAYFASYLMFPVFLGLYLFVSNKNNKKWFFLLYFILGSLVLFLTETRGAIIGWAVGMVAFGILWLGLNDKKNYRKFVFVPIVLFLLLGSSIYLFKDSKIVSEIGFLKRLSTISVTEGTSQSRLLMWQIAFKGFKEKPILGWGWGNFEVIFNKYYNPHLFNQEAWFDHAHNNLLDILTNLGVVGLLTYLSIIFTACFYLVKAWVKKIIDYKTLAVILGLFVAYLVQNLFIFDMVGAYLNLYIILALAYFLYSSGMGNSVIQKTKNKLSVYFYPAVILTAIVCYVINIKPVEASYYSTEALKYSALIQAQDVYLNNTKKALALNTFGSSEIRFQLILDHLKNLLDKDLTDDNKKQVSELSDLAISEFTKAISEDPTNLRNDIALAYVYLMNGKIYPEKGAEYFTKSLDLLKVGEKLSPDKQSIMFLQAENYVGLNKVDEALKVLRKAIDLDNSFEDPHINFLKIATFGKLNAEVLSELKEVDKLNLKLIPAELENLINIAAANKDYELVIEFYKRIIAMDDTNPKYHAGLAAVYAAIGENTLATNEAEKAMNLDPGFVEEGKTFIQMLKSGSLKR